jgi:hypothetical protein
MQDINISNDTTIKEKKKRNWYKPYKIDFHADLRKQFMDELSILLNLTEENNIVYKDLIDSEKIKNFINENEDKIKLYFNYYRWGYFKRNREETRMISALIKNIYKHEGYTIYCKQVTLKNKDNERYVCSKFIFYKNV